MQGRSLKRAMMMLILFLFCILSFGEQSPIIVEHRGVSYRGFTGNGVDQFLGIPYAEDTSGDNRFRPPIPYVPLHGSVIDATKPGPACPQAVKPIIPPMSDVDYQNEDCLNLRIARPAGWTDDKTSMPVMVFIHGGGSILGSIYDRFFNPIGLVQQSIKNDQPIVYVAMNYRLGVFGFPAAEVLKEEKSENLGLRDQLLALRWIRDNIAAFGGDPDNVTLFGQSFGSIAIGLLLTAWGGEGEPLFHKAIMASGSLARDRKDGLYKNNTAAVAQKIGCATDDGVVDAAAMKCMRSASLSDVAKANLDVATAIRPPIGFAAFTPVMDDDLVPDQASKLLEQGRFFKNIPLITTWTHDEWSLLVDPTIKTDAEILHMVGPRIPNSSPSVGRQLLSLYPLSDFEDQAKDFPGISSQYFRASRIIGDTDPRCPLLKIVQHVTDHSTSDVYVAELNETRMSPYWDAMGVPWGTCHISDIPYIFNERLLPPGNNSDAAFALGAQYAGSFISFATTGSPTTKGKETFQGWVKAESDGAFGVNALVIGGPYGSGLASTSPRSRFVSAVGTLLGKFKQIVLRPGHVNDFELTRRIPNVASQARNRALRAERLVERCAFWEALGLF